jgi:hypothetical protein
MRCYGAFIKAGVFMTDITNENELLDNWSAGTVEHRDGRKAFAYGEGREAVIKSETARLAREEHEPHDYKVVAREKKARDRAKSEEMVATQGEGKIIEDWATDTSHPEHVNNRREWASTVGRDAVLSHAAADAHERQERSVKVVGSGRSLF